MADPLDQFEPDPDLTEEQKHLVSLLTEDQIREIDEMLLSFVCDTNRKVARVVGSAMLGLPKRIKGVPDIYYAQRVKMLVKKGKVISEGNLDYMRFSEVRLPEVSGG